MFEFIVSYGVNKNRAMTLHSSSSNVKVSKLLVIYLEKFSFLTDVTLTSKVVLVADMRGALQRFSFETRPGPASASLFESARVLKASIIVSSRQYQISWSSPSTS